MSLNKYYKEKDYAENLLKKRAFDVGAKGDLKILAKYYKAQNMKYSEIDNLLKKFCETKGKKWYREALHFKMIDSAVNFTKKKENILVQIDSIGVTKSEMDYIETLDYTYLEKKILFAMLVINKLKQKKMKLKNFEVDYSINYFSGGSFSYKTMLDSLQEKLTRTFCEKEIHKIVKKFNDDGITRTANTTALELLFVSNIEKSDEIVLEIKDFDTIGLYYDSIYLSNKIKICEECKKKLIKISGKYTKYCKPCSSYKEKERKRISWHETKNKTSEF